MKKTAPLLIFVLAFGCTQSSGDKLKDTIENRLKNSDSFEHLKIDSFRYSLGSLQDYYISEIDRENDLVKERKALLDGSRETHDYSLIVPLSHNIMYQNGKVSYLTDLLTHTSPLDTTVEPKVYTIDYYIDYQTNQSNFQGHKREFLYAKNLKPVYIDIDSLYALTSTAISKKYDSAFDISILKMNDSLAYKIEQSKRDLELTISRGTTQENILNHEVYIARLKSTLAGNKVKYSYLYEY